MMGALLSNSTPHQVVVASPFQLGWKAVAVRSKQLPQGLLGGAAPALDEGEPAEEPEPDDEPEDEPDEADDEAAEPEEDAVALAEAEAEAEACEWPEEPDEEPAEEPDDEPAEEPAEEPALDEGDEPAEEPAEAPPPCFGLVWLEALVDCFLFLHTFLRWGGWAAMARPTCRCLLLSDLASASGALKPSVASTAREATAKNEERMMSMDRKGREHSCLRGSN